MSILAAMTRLAPLSLLLFIACSSSRERAEAMRLLDVAESIRVQDPLDVRRARLASLEHLELSTDKLEELRGACVRAHRSLIAAEEIQEEARTLIGLAARSGGSLGAEQRERIESALARSTAAAQESQTLFVGCNAPLEQLSRRLRGAR